MFSNIINLLISKRQIKKIVLSSFRNDGINTNRKKLKTVIVMFIYICDFIVSVSAFVATIIHFSVETILQYNHTDRSSWDKLKTRGPSACNVFGPRARTLTRYV